MYFKVLSGHGAELLQTAKGHRGQRPAAMSQRVHASLSRKRQRDDQGRDTDVAEDKVTHAYAHLHT